MCLVAAGVAEAPAPILPEKLGPRGPCPCVPPRSPAAAPPALCGHWLLPQHCLLRSEAAKCSMHPCMGPCLLLLASIAGLFCWQLDCRGGLARGQGGGQRGRTRASGTTSNLGETHFSPSDLRPVHLDRSPGPDRLCVYHAAARTACRPSGRAAHLAAGSGRHSGVLGYPHCAQGAVKCSSWKEASYL